jgi:hypothetical protein
MTAAPPSDDQDLLAAEYVLGTLDPDERAQARALASVREVLPVPPAAVVDLTPGWGYIAKTLEDAGFTCVAVSEDLRGRDMLERMRAAYGGAYTITHAADASFHAEAREPADAVLALSGLERLLASREDAARLASLLHANRPRMMIVRGSRAAFAFCLEAASLASVTPLPGAGSGVARLA